MTTSEEFKNELAAFEKMFRVGASDSFKLSVANHVASIGNEIYLHTEDPGTEGFGQCADTGGSTRWGAAEIATSGPEIGMAVIEGEPVLLPCQTNVRYTHYGVYGSGVFLYGRPLNPVAFFPQGDFDGYARAVQEVELTPTFSFGMS